ncbi:HAD family hydrolase [Halorhabdus tiamatea]|uniref:HAD-superfamily hydrolase n=1 Tax=Halorhabdus tiamatea SARL4B TaxID=1033806 RepID=F7PNS7_9EURY|nr:HAD family hydrolase [Halorhabdus tiamatea]CCQ33687.1 HAD-superfamily hydrolase [Halorhabdus tiamatea SARL4B]
MSYDAIVFDLDGVLLTGYHTAPAVYREAARETLADFDVTVEAVPENLINPDDTGEVRQFCDQHGLPPEAFWGYREHASTVLENERITAGEREPFEDVEVLARLAESATLGIVSNNRHGTVRFVREHFDWGEAFGAVRGRTPTLAGYDRMKPDPHYLESTLDKLGVEPAETLFVGDRLSDVETADRCGADSALLVRDGDRPAGEGDPTHVVESLRDLQALASGGA